MYGVIWEGASSEKLQVQMVSPGGYWKPVHQNWKLWFTLSSVTYNSCKIPSLWKKATIIPVPKKLRPKDLKNDRPIALPSLIMKCLEHLLLWKILQVVRERLDPLQFAYKTQRGTEDAVACLLHLLLGTLPALQQGFFLQISALHSTQYNVIYSYRN